MAFKPRRAGPATWSTSSIDRYLYLSRNCHTEDAYFLQSFLRFSWRYSERSVGITMTKWRVVLVDITGTGVRERVRRLYVAWISNKLSADPLARSFIMTSTRLPGCAWTRCHQTRVYMRAWVRACDRRISRDFAMSMHACE